MSITNKKISVITVVKNGQLTIRKCIESVLQQKTPEIEYIVIDGVSSDATLQIVSEYESEIDHVISESDKGIYDAWNKGVNISTGSYIAFLGADDIYLPNALNTYLGYIDIYPHIDFISSQARFDAPNGRVFGRAWKWAEFRRHFFPAHVGSMHSRRLFEKYGLFDDSYKIAGDYDFLLRVGAGLSAGYIDQLTVEMGAFGISNSRIFKLLRETNKAKLSNGAATHFECRVDACKTLLAFYKNRFKGMFG